MMHVSMSRQGFHRERKGTAPFDISSNLNPVNRSAAGFMNVTIEDDHDLISHPFAALTTPSPRTHHIPSCSS